MMQIEKMQHIHYNDIHSSFMLLYRLDLKLHNKNQAVISLKKLLIYYIENNIHFLALNCS